MPEPLLQGVAAAAALGATMTFTVPAGDVTTGVVWDYLRLELNDGSKAYPTAPASGRPDAPAEPPLVTNTASR